MSLGELFFISFQSLCGFYELSICVHKKKLENFQSLCGFYISHFRVKGLSLNFFQSLCGFYPANIQQLILANNFQSLCGFYKFMLKIYVWDDRFFQSLCGFYKSRNSITLFTLVSLSIPLWILPYNGLVFNETSRSFNPFVDSTDFCRRDLFSSQKAFNPFVDSTKVYIFKHEIQEYNFQSLCGFYMNRRIYYSNEIISLSIPLWILPH